MKRDFSLLLWMFASPRETRDIIRLNLHEAGLVHDDRHLTELGNEILAQGLYSELKKYE